MAVTVTPASVRAYLHVLLDSNGLPDNTVNLSGYAGEAKAIIKRRVPNADSASGDQAARLNDAADYLTGALLAPAITDVMSILLPKGQAFDWQAKQAELRARAEVEIALALAGGDATVAAASVRPTAFALAHGGRGR